MNTLILTAALQFIGPCSEVPLLKTQVAQVGNVGSVTIDALNKAGAPYVGSEQGLNSAFKTPTGMEALEVISDREMRSYGWCFAVDGDVPEDYADAVSMDGVKQVTWYFAFAHYLDGHWISQCEPAYKTKPAFLCGTTH